MHIIFSVFFVDDIWILSIDYLLKHFRHEESSGLESSLEYSNRCRDAFYCPCKTRHPQLRDCDVSNGNRKAEIFNGAREKMEGVETKISYGDFSQGRDIRLSDGYFYCPEFPDVSKRYAERSN